MERPVWMDRVHPIGDNVACIPINREKETKGGLVLPDSSATGGKTVVAQVFAVGIGATLPGGELKVPEIEMGDIVVFVKAGSYQEVIVDGETFWVVSEQDVLLRYTEQVTGR